MITRRLFLIGMPASGKTHTGRGLAALLDYNFWDNDAQIELQSGFSIPEIFQNRGESYFRYLEREILLKTGGLAQNTVVSTGGGVPCFFDNMDWMLTHGTVIFLNPPLHILQERIIAQLHTRPLFKQQNPDTIGVFIANMLQNRLPFYQRAHHSFSQTDRVLEAIHQKLKA